MSAKETFEIHVSAVCAQGRERVGEGEQQLQAMDHQLANNSSGGVYNNAVAILRVENEAITTATAMRVLSPWRFFCASERTVRKKRRRLRNWQTRGMIGGFPPGPPQGAHKRKAEKQGAVKQTEQQKTAVKQTEQQKTAVKQTEQQNRQRNGVRK
jgi:hypothetical protein